MPDPSPDQSRLLEPANIAYEIAVSTDSNVQHDLREELSEDELGGYIKKRLGIGFWISLAWLILVIFLAIAAPAMVAKGIMPSYETINKINVNNPSVDCNVSPSPPGCRADRFAGPSLQHWLGTDNLGRDVFSRLCFGAQVSLAVGFASIFLGLVIGTMMGLVSGYLKGWVDNVLMTAVDIILAFPALLLAMAIITFTDGHDIAHISLAIGIVAVPAIARLVRANTLSFREREFVLASRTLGASHLRILAREILPNVLPPVVSFAVIGVAVAIAAESGLAFVGITVPLPTPTWGGMINDARASINDHPMQVIVPCTVLVITIMSLYFVGDKLRQYFDVKEGVL